MIKRYYFTICYTPDYADCELLAGRCISQMHFFMVNNQQSMHKIGVSFPSWNETTVGQTISFVSEDKEVLTRLSFQPYFSLMANKGLFVISRVCDVPDSATEVRYVRNQTIGKNFLGSKIQRMKRSIARAEQSGVEQQLPVTKEERVIDNFHRVPISSSSSGEDYFLFVQKELATNERSIISFNSYGLATNQEKRGTVPDL